MWSRKSIALILVLSLFSFYPFNHITVKADDQSTPEKKDPYTISSKDYLFPSQGLEKKENVTELASTVLGFFNMELNDINPKIETYPWQVTGSNSTQYTFEVGERKYYKKNFHQYATRTYYLDINYFGDLFYRLSMNFDWNLGGDLEKDTLHIINEMKINDMNMLVQKNNIDFYIIVRSQELGFNDTNYVRLFEGPSYEIDDGKWSDGRELQIGAWFNNSMNNYKEVYDWRSKLSEDIFNDYVLLHSERARNLNLSWIRGAENEFTWFKLDAEDGSLKLSIWPELKFRYYFILPDPTGLYWFQVNLSRNGSILGYEEGRYQESTAPSPDEIDSWIIHYHYDPDEKWSPYEKTSNTHWLWFVVISLLSIIVIVLVSSIVVIKRAKKNILDNLTRKRIYDTIKEHQGIHFRDLMKKVDIKQGVLGYHLNILEDENYIKSIQRGNKRCFFTRDDKGDLKLKLNIAQQKILHEINLNPGISLKDLAKVTSKTPTLVYYHTSILMDAGLIEKEREGKRSHFFISTLGRGYVI